MLISHSLRCIQVIAGVLGRAGEAGQKQRLEAAAKGVITYRPAKGLVIPEAEGETDSVVKAAGGRDRRTPKRADALAADEINDDSKGFGEGGGIVDAEEMANKMDEVGNREDHRVKGGRELRASS
jgi:small subunit ribosomal protein S2